MSSFCFSFLRQLPATLAGVLVLLLILEGIARLAGLPRGAGYFAEMVVHDTGLPFKKPKDEYRIFTYGESTMHGAHYAPRSSPARWLEAYLQDFLPGRSIKVTNFARLGKGSDFHLRTFQETVGYQPDLVIFYMGHNDFAPKERFDDVAKNNAKFGFVAYEWIKESRFISAFMRRVIVLQMKRKRQMMADRMGNEAIEAPLQSGPSERYLVSRHDATYNQNIAFFAENVRRIARLAREQSIPVIFMKPVCNLKEHEPHYSVHSDGLSPESLKEWESIYQAGAKLQDQGNAIDALPNLLKVYELDPAYAEGNFRLGRIYFEQGEIEKAKEFFVRAKDHDGLPRRATTEILRFFDELRDKEGVPVLDTEKVLLPYAAGGIMGEPVIEDNVHFSVQGHAAAGRALADLIYKLELFPKSEWRFERARAYDRVAEDWNLNEKDFILNSYLKTVDYYGRHFPNRIRIAEKMISFAPDDARALRSIAWSHWLKGDREKAAQYYDKLSRLHPADLEKVFQSSPEVRAYLEALTPAQHKTLPGAQAA